MTYKVLARKWRPKRFEDVIGQQHVTRSLQNAISRGKVGQAYVLTGTRGIGKTSVARLFAKALRCENLEASGNACGKCSCCQDYESGSSMNIIEIDGASNNGVDNIRELIEDVHYLPTIGKYKVYIIDEVHMVTTQAFNALLKTLEEPPAHVVFIFATTEPQKLLGTVLSRCQRFDFRHVDVDGLKEHVLNIAKHEGIRFDDEKLVEQICKQGSGSVRDTLSLLDQVLTYSENNNITEETLVMSLGLARLSAVREVSESILVGDFSRVASVYRQLITENVEVKNIVISLLDYFYDLIDNIDNVETLYETSLVTAGLLDKVSAPELFWIYESLAKDSEWIFNSIDPVKVTDVVLQKIALRRTFLEDEQAGIQEQISQDKKKKEVIKKDPPKPKTWDDFLDYLNSSSPATAANLEQGNIVSGPIVESDRIQVEIGFDQSGKIFLDYMQEKEASQKLKKHLSDFYSVSQVEVNLVGVDDKKKEESNFRSRAEIKLENEEKLMEQKRQEFLETPIIKEAEKLFSSKVDKVIMNRKKG